MPSKTTYLTTLTPLRGIAALLVVIFHCNLVLMKCLPDGYTQLITSGWLWVDFFFVLSGFIMSYVYAKYFFEGCTWEDFFSPLNIFSVTHERTMAKQLLMIPF